MAAIEISRSGLSMDDIVWIRSKIQEGQEDGVTPTLSLDWAGLHS